MYTIPINYNLNRLKNTKIIQVCFTLNTISLFFEKAGYIGIEGGFSFVYGGNRYDYKGVYPIINDYNLLKLLEKEVTNVYTNAKRTELTLEFEENMVLELIGSEMYESFTLNIHGEKVIV